MITREAFLAQVASLIYINVKPLDAFQHVWETRVTPELPSTLHPIYPLVADSYNTRITGEAAWIVDVTDNLSYSIRDNWGDIRQRGRGGVYGSITADHHSHGPVATSTLMSALLVIPRGQGGLYRNWDPIPESIAELAATGLITQLPSRTNDHGLAASAPVLSAAGAPLDPDLEESEDQVLAGLAH